MMMITITGKIILDLIGNNKKKSKGVGVDKACKIKALQMLNILYEKNIKFFIKSVDIQKLLCYTLICVEAVSR